MRIIRDALEAASLLIGTRGALIAYPTETFYGLGARISDDQGLERIIAVKGRDASKGMIVLVPDMGSALSLAEIDDRQRSLLARVWPGPVSAVLKARPGMHPLLSPGGKISMRISPNPLALALVGKAGPLTSTSANPAGRPPASTAAEVVSWNLAINAVLDGGKTPGGKPSTLIDLTVWPPECLREGAVSFSTILESL